MKRFKIVVERTVIEQMTFTVSATTLGSAKTQVKELRDDKRDLDHTVETTPWKKCVERIRYI